MAGAMILFGFMLFITPNILMAKDGVRSIEDIETWLMNLPLQMILMLQASISGGVFFLMAGAALMEFNNG